MKQIFTFKWAKAAVVRAIKTVAQTAIATIGTAALLGEVTGLPWHLPPLWLVC